VVTKGVKVTSRRKRRVVKEVAAVEEKALRAYELVLIISPGVNEEEFEATLNNISQFISDNGGAVSHVEQWGRRKLAYAIDRFTEGSYVLTRFEMRPTLSKDLEAKLKISEKVLRHLLIRLST
jgi:small subunit ribosomal protein S6|tara:strand:+ start:2339 stop:2707 length:369 start_codon:yes stop_codon:yes gene_type:complete